MAATTNFLAVDLGASNGRILLARWDGERFDLQVLHRFANGPTQIHGRLYWDVLRLWAEIQSGMAHYAAQVGEPLAGIGVDTWGVDFGLFDSAGRLLANPTHYRDERFLGMPEALFHIVPKETVFDITGIQFIQFNTLFQVYSLRYFADPLLDFADRLLMMPDIFHYWLTGRQCAEYTIASTSQMIDARDRRWATGLMAKLGLPTGLLPEVVPPGTVLGNVLPGVMVATGLRGDVPVIAPGSHDTASAVAAVPDLDTKSLYISSGTWSLMGAEIREPIITERARELNFTNEGGVDGTIRLLKNIGGLWLLQESRRQWQREGADYSWDDLTNHAQNAAPFRALANPDAVEFLNPVNMVEAIQSYCRNTGQLVPETVGEIVRCSLEGLALRYRWVLGALEELTGEKLETMRIVGGGSQNRMLSQLAADACGRPVVTGPVEATALGNVMVQAIATGHLSNVAEGREAIAASIEQEIFEPGRLDGWDEAYDRFSRVTGDG
jgi:rhamnulokinase